MKKSEKQPEATQPKTKVCNRCHQEKPIQSDYRIHKSGYVLTVCRVCEREISRNRARSKKVIPTTESKTPATFTIKTKRGKEFIVSTEAFVGARMVTNGEHTLYFPAGSSKDDTRSAFISHFKCHTTSISTKIIE
jgi:hypothetical protein